MVQSARLRRTAVLGGSSLSPPCQATGRSWTDIVEQLGVETAAFIVIFSIRSLCSG
jgi:hypothetical protein